MEWFSEIIRQQFRATVPLILSQPIDELKWTDLSPLVEIPSKPQMKDIPGC